MATIEEMKEKQRQDSKAAVDKMVAVRKEAWAALKEKQEEVSLKRIILKAFKKPNRESNLLELVISLAEEEGPADNSSFALEIMFIQSIMITPSLDSIIANIENMGIEKASQIALLPDTFKSLGDTLFGNLETINTGLTTAGEMVQTVVEHNLEKSDPAAFRTMMSDLESRVATLKWLRTKYEGYLGASELLEEKFHLQDFSSPVIDAEITLSVLTKVTKSGIGCFVATACYGSFETKEVKILRLFRDEYLERFNIGRAFSKFYYSVGPKAADIIDRHPFLKTTVRLAFLQPIVAAVSLLPRVKDDAMQRQDSK